MWSGTSQIAWQEAERYAREISNLETAHIVDEVLGAGLIELEQELEASPRLRGLKRAFTHLVKNRPTKAELMRCATLRPASGKVVLVPMAHQFNSQHDAEASAFQQ